MLMFSVLVLQVLLALLVELVRRMLRVRQVMQVHRVAKPCLALPLLCLDKPCQTLPTLANPGQSMTALPCLGKPFIDLQCRALPRAASHSLVKPCQTRPCLGSTCLTLPCLVLP